MKVYLRYIHKISQNPEQDTVGPFTVEPEVLSNLDKLWKWCRRQQDCLAKQRNGDHRHQDGGAVFFLRGTFHSLIVMPVETPLFAKHAPPSLLEAM